LPVQFGAHLPLIDFDGSGWRPSDLVRFTEAARESGFSAIAANDHFVFQRPWLDGIVALASVVSHSGDMMLATTVTLPVLRHPVALAKAAAALDLLSGGRLVLGVGPGSSARDYESAGLDFDERWRRLDESLKVLRFHLKANAPAFEGKFYSATRQLEPKPNRDVPIWIGSWGSDAGLRRVARLGDGWLASAYNTNPQLVVEGRQKLAGALRTASKVIDGFPCALSTMWTYVTTGATEQRRYLHSLAGMLGRHAEVLSGQVLIGPPEECAAKLRAYADAGIERVFIWPLADGPSQLERFMRQVAPLVG
jgi:alkanesulfonate monooxygenase SsuD/methylene tetrahydromethanopterin reductase-like flavin-dependent oxidoreductase (luciferase family)